MGLQVSRPECNLPTRMLLGLSNARSVALNCARHKILWVWGFLFVVTIAATVAWYYTKSRPADELKVPAWLITVPPVFGLLYATHARAGALQQLESDAIEQQLSGMSKKDYIGYKIGDDRTATSFAATATSAGVLSGTNLLGPFLRGDNR